MFRNDFNELICITFDQYTKGEKRDESLNYNIDRYNQNMCKVGKESIKRQKIKIFEQMPSLRSARGSLCGRNKRNGRKFCSQINKNKKKRTEENHLLIRDVQPVFSLPASFEGLF
jgi:hypothetical protein